MEKKHKTETELKENEGRSANKKMLGEKRSENPFKSTFLLLFDKITFRNQESFMNFMKWMLFIILLVVQTLMLVQNIEKDGSVWEWIRLGITAALCFSFTALDSIQRFALKNKTAKLVLNTVNTVTSCLLVFFGRGVYPLLIFMVVLTDFYIATEKKRVTLPVFGVCTLTYSLCFGAHKIWERWISSGSFDVAHGLRQMVDPIFALAVHFIAAQLILAFYRQYLKLNKTMLALDESKQELEKAYAVVAEVTALEERQRIAKDIHDTAGHSITTVIMQTESAKRIIDDNPEEAKTKIIAANLQAKHALEELRNSVHLLSGVSENKAFKDALMDIIHESTDGTGIKIRSEIEDIFVSEAKYRFLCNTLKEGISNGLRHGNATAFWFELKQEKGEMVFLLSDNGKGLNGVLKEGFGLSTMRERVKAFGGTLTVHSEIDEGFEIEIKMPMDAEEM